MAEPGALTAALNWYRAMPVSDVHSTSTKIGVPTLYVWSDGDTAVLSNGARNCGRYANGEYRFETCTECPTGYSTNSPMPSPTCCSSGLLPIPLAQAEGLLCAHIAPGGFAKYCAEAVSRRAVAGTQSAIQLP